MSKSFLCRGFQSSLPTLKFTLRIWTTGHLGRRGKEVKALTCWACAVGLLSSFIRVCSSVVHFSLLFAWLHFLLCSRTEATGYRILSFVSASGKGGGIEGSREKNLGGRTSVMSLWNISALILYYKQSLVFGIFRGNGKKEPGL